MYHWATSPARTLTPPCLRESVHTLPFLLLPRNPEISKVQNKELGAAGLHAGLPPTPEACLEGGGWEPALDS